MPDCYYKPLSHFSPLMHSLYNFNLYHKGQLLIKGTFSDSLWVAFLYRFDCMHFWMLHLYLYMDISKCLFFPIENLQTNVSARKINKLCIMQSCQTWLLRLAKIGQILTRTDQRLVFCNRKLMKTDMFSLGPPIPYAISLKWFASHL